MPSEFIQRQIDKLLAEAAEAIGQSDWQVVTELSRNVLALDPENAYAAALIVAAERAHAGAANRTSVPAALAEASTPQPTSFASGRCTVSKFLGEGGKKKVYLAHDALLDRDVAFALIKAEGLHEASRVRITREAQAMGRLGDQINTISMASYSAR